MYIRTHFGKLIVYILACMERIPVQRASPGSDHVEIVARAKNPTKLGVTGQGKEPLTLLR